MSIGIGDLVLTSFKNRWNLDCCGTVEEIKNKEALIEVYNIHGPGANQLVWIPLSELKQTS